MNDDWLRITKQFILGRRCRIVRREFDWAADLVGGGSISIHGLWRIVADDRVALASGDDGHWFGLPEPFDVESQANWRIGTHAITALLVADETADLTLHFENGIRLEAFCHSFGYEAWQISPPPNSDFVSVVAKGGGEIVIF